MLKTRAYLCQTVTEATLGGRLASTVFGQARQALEGLFRRIEGLPKVPSGVVTRTEAPVLAVGRRGLVASIDRGGRGVIRQFLARNRPADLAAAMRQRYSVRGQFQGLGHRLATFGFVGVGVAAGAQWDGSDVDREFHFEPFYDTVQAMFDGGKGKVDRSLAMLTDFQKSLDDFAQFESASCADVESSFVLLDDSYISSEASCPSTIGQLSILSDAAVEQTNQESAATEVQIQLSSSIEDSQAQLGTALLIVQSTVDTQHRELCELSAIVSRLNDMLHELTGTRVIVDGLVDDFEVIEEDDREDDDLIASDERRLQRALSLISSQSQQIDIFHKTVQAQNEQLLSLTGQTTSGNTVIPRSAHCKRDACCGPGSAG